MKNSESATLRSSTILSERKKKGLKIYNAGLGANPIKQHSALINTLIKYSNNKEYISPSGIEELNQKINKKYSTKYALVGNGLKELIFTLLVGWKYEVLLVTPCWVSYIEQTKILNRKTYFIETKMQDNFKLNDILLEKTITNINNNKPKLLFLNNPTNPTGAVYSVKELENIAKVCKKHDIIVFSDEIYMDITHNNINTISFNKLYKKTITGSSLSKNFACGGYRVGWLTFTKELKELYDQLHIIASSTYSCASHCLQNVASEALNYDESMINYLKKQRDIFTNISILVYNKFKYLNIKTSIPMGGWYIFIDLNKFKEKFLKNNINNDIELAERLINDIGLITVSGSNFGYQGYYLRFSIVDINFKNNDNNIENKSEFDYNFMAKRIVKGIEELNKWLIKLK